MGACFAVDVQKHRGSGASDAPVCCGKGFGTWRDVGVGCVRGEERSNLDYVGEEGVSQILDLSAYLRGEVRE